MTMAEKKGKRFNRGTAKKAVSLSSSASGLGVELIGALAPCLLLLLGGGSRVGNSVLNTSLTIPVDLLGISQVALSWQHDAAA